MKYYDAKKTDAASEWFKILSTDGRKNIKAYIHEYPVMSTLFSTNSAIFKENYVTSTVSRMECKNHLIYLDDIVSKTQLITDS